MKNITRNTSLKFHVLFAILFLAIASGCMKIDEITGANAFNRQDGELALRRYSGMPLNIPPLVQFISDKSEMSNLLLKNHMKKICN